MSTPKSTRSGLCSQCIRSATHVPLAVSISWYVAADWPRRWPRTGRRVLCPTETPCVSSLQGSCTFIRCSHSCCKSVSLPPDLRILSSLCSSAYEPRLQTSQAKAMLSFLLAARCMLHRARSMLSIACCDSFGCILQIYIYIIARGASMSHRACFTSHIPRRHCIAHLGWRLSSVACCMLHVSQLLESRPSNSASSSPTVFRKKTT